jgi:glycosyltransferase involved in cell wall biosynthesis
MRIAIDARAYFQRTGIARYTRELVHAIVAASPRDEFLILISDHHQPHEVPLGGDRVEVRVSAAGWLNGQAERTRIAREVQGWDADLFHSIFPPIAVSGVPSIVTVFDLTPLSHPQLHQSTVVGAFLSSIGPAVKGAARVVAISEATADETRRRFPAAAPRTRVAGVGLPAAFLRQSPTERPRSGVLFVGTIEPRKNVPLVVETARRLRARGYRDPITIVGKPGWGGYDVASAIADLPGVRYRGYVSDVALRGLYRRAAIFLYPSAAEGFGLPVLEAMSQGALPLISADPALREVVRDPALVVDVDDPEGVADAVVKWSKDTALRAGKIGRMTRRARQYSWDRAARQVVRLYKDVA